jgi:hypothetical protein
MNRLLTLAALIAAVTIAAPVFAATPFAPQPLGGPYVSETAPSPPSTILPGYAYRPYSGGFYGALLPVWELSVPLRLLMLTDGRRIAVAAAVAPPSGV